MLEGRPATVARFFFYAFAVVFCVAAGMLLVERGLLGSGSAGGAAGLGLTNQGDGVDPAASAAAAAAGDAGEPAYSAAFRYGEPDTTPRTPKDPAPLQGEYDRHQRVVHVVSHTHWDREWYMPFEKYRRRFVWLLDDVMDRMRRNPQFRHFHMDGQVVPFVDYFEVRPSRKAEVLRAVREGKLSIGPWYTAPDEFLASPEALVRNLQNGLRHARRWGVGEEWMRVGYMADTFGHVSQIPQIYRLFGIGNAVFARGVAGPAAEMWWTGPDGSRVFCVYMVAWYCNAEGSPGDRGSGPGWLAGRTGAVASRGQSKHVLLMSGCDHTSFDPNILENMQAANAQGGDLYVHSNLEHFVAVSERDVGSRGIRTIEGEQRAEIGGLSHINSNKMSQKQANWECMTLLEHYAEPMRALLWSKGAMANYEGDYIWYAWEKILENHAHDSIGGCSVTEVHRDVDHRFRRCLQVGRQLVDEALMALSSAAETPSDAHAAVAVFNTLGFRRSEETFVVRLNSDGRVGEAPDVVDYATGEQVPAEVIFSEGSMWDYALPNHGFRKPMRLSRCWVAIRTGKAGVPALGHKVFQVRRMTGGAGPRRGPLAGEGAAAGAMENEHLKVQVSAGDGSVTMTDKASGQSYSGLCRLVVVTDHGDEYHSRPGGGGQIGDVQLASCTAGPVGQRCLVKARLSINGGSMPVAILYFLAGGSRRLDIRVSVNNGLGDFRLRAHFSAEGLHESLADQHFDVVQRGLSSPDEERAQLDFVTMRAGDRGFTVSNRGLPGYEVEGSSLGVTLLRAVSHMSDWATFPTAPSSQEQGVHHFELAVEPYRAAAAAEPPATEARAPSSHESANAFNVPLAAVHALNYPGVMNSKPLFDLRQSLLSMMERDMAPSESTTTGMEPNPSSNGGGGGFSFSSPTGSRKLGRAGSLATVEPAGLLTVSSVKVSEARDPLEPDGGTLVVRWYNPGNGEVSARVCVDAPATEAHLVNMREDRLEKLQVRDNCLVEPVRTATRQIRTVEFVIKRA